MAVRSLSPLFHLLDRVEHLCQTEWLRSELSRSVRWTGLPFETPGELSFEHLVAIRK
jgi:hypothetical protein